MDLGFHGIWVFMLHRCWWCYGCLWGSSSDWTWDLQVKRRLRVVWNQAQKYLMHAADVSSSWALAVLIQLWGWIGRCCCRKWMEMDWLRKWYMSAELVTRWRMIGSIQLLSMVNSCRQWWRWFDSGAVLVKIEQNNWETGPLLVGPSLFSQVRYSNNDGSSSRQSDVGSDDGLWSSGVGIRWRRSWCSQWY